MTERTEPFDPSVHPVEFDVFVDELQDMVMAWIGFWQAGHKADPENYPGEMLTGEWWDQFLSFATEER
jgi:hypothetical protein